MTTEDQANALLKAAEAKEAWDALEKATKTLIEKPDGWEDTPIVEIVARMEAAANIRSVGSLASALLEKHKVLEEAEARLSRLSALLDEAEAALDVFSQIAEHDIGETEADCDIFRPLTKDSVPPITVGDLRLAASVAAKIAKEKSDEA